MEPIKTAVVGCGVISGIYLQNMAQRFSILDVVACCDKRQEVAQKTAEKHGIRAMGMEEILADPSIQLVVNLTTPEAHYPVIRRLLEGGKHVYTEKPLATNLEDAAELVRIAQQKGRHLAAAPDTFLGAAFQTARVAVDCGLIGDVTSCVVALNRDSSLMVERYPFTALPGGGIGTDVGIYYVTALLSLLGPVREVCGMVDTVERERTHYFPSRQNFGERYSLQCENLVAGSFRFESGVAGSLHLNSNCIQNEMPHMILYGTQGLLYLPDPNHFGGEVRYQLKGQAEPVVFPHTHGYAENSRGLGVADLAWAIRMKRAPRADKSLALHGLELLLGMMESSNTRAFYTMTSAFERPAPLPRGFLGEEYFGSDAEGALAL